MGPVGKMGKIFSAGHRTRSNGFKLREGRFRIDIRKKYFAMRGETLEQITERGSGGSSLETFKAKLDGSLSNLV